MDKNKYKNKYESTVKKNEEVVKKNTGAVEKNTEATNELKRLLQEWNGKNEDLTKDINNKKQEIER